MRFILLSLVFCASTVWAAPTLSISMGKSSDGLQVFCKQNADVGIWAYTLNDATVAESATHVDFKFDIGFIKCASTGSAFDWIARQPYEPISRMNGGKVDITLVDQVNGVLYDGDTFARVDTPASHDVRQIFALSYDKASIQKKIDGLRPGQSYSKTFYFLIENHETFANGSSRWLSGGSYDLTVTWTK